MGQWICGGCGYEMQLDEMPKYCPSCGGKTQYAGPIPNRRSRRPGVTINIDSAPDDDSTIVRCATCKGTGSKYAGGLAPLFGGNEPCPACGGSGWQRV